MALARLPPIGSSKAQDISPRRSVKYDGLNGPQYALANNTAKYSLPQPHVLKPHQDTKAGGLETWPAHCTGQASTGASATVNRHKQLVLVDEESQGKPQMVPKPSFLSQLETFLKKELRSLNADRVEPSELRLQAYREVFEYLIEDFKTYKPLLSAVKNEYEMMLAHQRQQIRQMEPLKQMLVTVSEQCDQKIMALRDQEKQEMTELKAENKRLYQRIDKLRQEHLSLEAQVEKMQEELAAEYLKYRDECDARKLLISDMNELRNQQEDMMMSQQAMDEEEEKDDPITLKIALKKAREDEADATRRLNVMIADYGDVIPRRDFEQLQKDYKVRRDTLEQSKADYDKLKEEHEVKIEEFKLVLQERNDYYTKLETTKRSSTPRPQWERCADHVSGGAMRWRELSENKSSNELVEVLLMEIAGASGDVGGAEYFDGQGTGLTVSRYLQYEGRVRNRRLGKRDVLLLVKDIWREKAAHDAEKNNAGLRESMADFLHTYLQRRFGIEQMVVEWGYNLHDACQRYQHDESIGLFWRVLNGEADQEIYHQQLQQITRLLNHLTKADLERGNQGTLARQDFKDQLKAFYPEREEDQLSMLLRAADTELGAPEPETIDYRSLFMEDDEGKTGPFLDELRTQQRNERLAFVDEIKQELESTSPVTPEELKRAMLTLDPQQDAYTLDKMLCWAFSVADADGLASAESQDQSVLIARLQQGHVVRAGPKK